MATLAGIPLPAADTKPTDLSPEAGAQGRMPCHSALLAVVPLIREINVIIAFIWSDSPPFGEGTGLCLLSPASPQPNPNSGNLVASSVAAWAGDRLAPSHPCWSHDSIDKIIVPTSRRAALGAWDSKIENGGLRRPACMSLLTPTRRDRDRLWSLKQPLAFTDTLGFRPCF